MKKSEYDTLLSYVSDPYQGYLSLRNRKESPIIDEKALEGTKKELKSMGYRFYFGEGGEVEPAFFVKALDRCEQSLENKGRIPELIYCDEDRRTDVYRDPFFKPDFSPDTLESFFYIGGAFLLRTDEGEDFEIPFSGRDYLRLAGKVLGDFVNTGLMYDSVHITEVLFHSVPEADYSYPEGARPRMIYPEEHRSTSESITVRAVILSKDNPDQLFECIDSFINNADSKIDFLVVDNGSNEINRNHIKTGLEKRGIEYLYNPGEFIYSALCNLGAKSGNNNYDHLLLLNDDVILPKSTAGFPSQLLRKASQPHVGAVGVKLYYPSENFMTDIHPDGKMSIQHAGIYLTEEGPAHKLSKFNDDIIYERGRNRGVWDVMAVTGACMLVDREKFFSVGGFDERLKISYTDVDLCMDLQESGYYNIVMNDMPLLHFESFTRGEDTLAASKAERLKTERDLFYGKHKELRKKGDRFYNPNLKRRGPGFDPDFDLPWEVFTLSQRLNETEIDRISEKDGIMGSIDSFSFKASSFDGTEDIYEILGWCILHGADMLKHEPAVALKISGKTVIYRAQRSYRRDLGEVFPKERNVLLSGFICRIPSSQVKDLEKGDVRPALIREGFWSKKQAVYVMGGKVE